jgi:hypothetical protein
MSNKFILPEFKCRCSAIGLIMTEPQGKSYAEKVAEAEAAMNASREKQLTLKIGSKSLVNELERFHKYRDRLAELLAQPAGPNLSKTCVSFLESWVNEHLYGRRLEFTSKQTDKGISVEADGIIYAAGHISDMGLALKNTQKFNNEFLTGEPDVLTDLEVLDIKASWSHGTFPLYETELPEPKYAWQILGYMPLTERQRGRVVYALMSMPEEMILREARYKLGYEYSQEQYEEFAAQFRYDDLPPYLRLKEFPVQYDAEKIEAIYQRVKDCRTYIKTVILPTLESNFSKYAPAPAF